jgi:hypothetical protein
MQPDKIELERYRDAKELGYTSISHSLPFFKSKQGGKYYHRVRSAGFHKLGNRPHISISFWCGNSGFIGEKGALYKEVPEDGVLCAVCEGKAVGAGLDGVRIINGRKVMYSPRSKS